MLWKALLSILFILLLFSPFISSFFSIIISSSILLIFPLLSLSFFSSIISSFVEVVVVSLPFFITVLVVVTIFFSVIIWGISFITIFDSLFEEEETSVALLYIESIFDIPSFIGWNIIFLLSIESGKMLFNSDGIEFMSWEGFSGFGIASIVSLGKDCIFPEFSALIF